MEFKHISVLLNEAVEGLNIKSGGLYVDGTLGGGGHSLEILKKGGNVLGIDRDTDAIIAAKNRLRDFGERVTYIHDNFCNIKSILGEKRPDGFILDLGVSSYQFDSAERGFSYKYNAPLDMRMDREASLSAYDVVNGYSMEELWRILKEYGEERWAKRIALFIIEERSKKPIETTFELTEVIKKAIPKKARLEGGHPSKRTFQAIRIEVNNELGVLEGAVEDMVRALKPGGRICVITFHSLEDRIVKRVFKRLENPCICPRELPVCVCGRKPLVKIITKKPVTAKEEELLENNRARSAKLRIAERVEEN